MWRNRPPRKPQERLKSAGFYSIASRRAGPIIDPRPGGIENAFIAMKPKRILPRMFLCLLLLAPAWRVQAQNVAAPAQTFAGALPSEKWSQLQKSVDRSLAWLAAQQNADGSFPSLDTGQPGVTGLCVMAFLSRGYQPGFGPYGQQLNRAVDFVLSCQRPDGLFSYATPEPYYTTGTHASKTASYNHAIAGLMLGEVYGHVTGARARKVRAGLSKALQFTRALQARPKKNGAAMRRGAISLGAPGGKRCGFVSHGVASHVLPVGQKRGV